MSKQDRLAWISRGSPFTLMRPAARLRDRLRAHGYTVYDIGNRDHLEHEPPEDHTPYSSTGWPGRARYGTGYAIDIMPPKSGQKSKLNGRPLPSLQQLGARMVADRTAGVAGIRWLKYMNWEPQGNYTGPCYQDSWKPRYARRSSSDRGHIHQSGATGYETSTIGDAYDPVARVYGEDDDVSAADVWGAEVGRGDTRRSMSAVVVEGSSAAVATLAQVVALRSVVETLAETIRAGGGSVDTAAILGGVDARVTRAVQEVTADTRDAVADLGEGGASQVRADAGPAS